MDGKQIRKLATTAAMLWVVLGHVELARADMIAYVVAHDFNGSNVPDLFGQVDVSTGHFAQIAVLNTPGYSIFGMGFGSDGQIYGEGQSLVNARDAGELFRIDPATGAATDLGPLNFPVDGAAGNGDGRLFSLDFEYAAKLYSTVVASNTTTLIGSLPFPADGLVAVDSSGNLYAAGNLDGSFYRIDTTDASFTLIGNTGLGSNLYAGTFVGDTLYGFSVNGPNVTIVTVDATNAAVATGPNVDLPANYLISAATASAVPEPTSCLLAVMGAVGVLTYGLLRKKFGDRGLRA